MDFLSLGHVSSFILRVPVISHEKKVISECREQGGGVRDCQGKQEQSRDSRRRLAVGYCTQSVENFDVPGFLSTTFDISLLYYCAVGHESCSKLES